MAVSEANVITNVAALTSFSVQTQAQAGTTPPTGTTSSILYNSASRRQGNFTVFYAIATDKLTEDLAQKCITATDAQKEKALAYLVADAQEKKDPDWSARSISIGGYSIGRNTGSSNQQTAKTGSMDAYEALLASLPVIESTPSEITSGDITETRDSEYYPDSWRLSGLNRDATPEEGSFGDLV